MRQVTDGTTGQVLAVLDDEWHVPVVSVTTKMRLVFTTFDQPSLGAAGFRLRWRPVRAMGLCASG